MSALLSLTGRWAFAAFMLVMLVYSTGLVVGMEPVGRPYGQPALVSDQAATRLAPSGFDQAQERGL